MPQHVRTFMFRLYVVRWWCASFYKFCKPLSKFNWVGISSSDPVYNLRNYTLHFTSCFCYLATRTLIGWFQIPHFQSFVNITDLKAFVCFSVSYCVYITPLLFSRTGWAVVRKWLCRNSGSIQILNVRLQIGLQVDHCLTSRNLTLAPSETF